MPVQSTIRVVVGEKPGGVKVGDYITINGQFGQVESQELKSSWAYYRLRDDKKPSRRLPIGSEVNVTRSVLGEGEKLEQQRTKLVEKLQHDRRLVINEFNHAADGIEQAVNEANHDQLTPIASWRFEDLLVSQAKRDIWLVVDSALEHMEGTWTIIEAVHYMSERAKDELLSDSSLFRAMSRSSGTMANLMADVKREQLSQFIRDNQRVSKYSYYNGEK